MADSETRNVIVSQPDDTPFALAGSDCAPPMQHRVGADITHRTEKPIVHMHLWNEDCVGKLAGTVTVAGDPDAPVALQHRFPDEHRQTHAFTTSLAKPVHHALQMRTPLQVRFCNSWHVASDYTVGIQVNGRSLIGIRLTGATVATPQPCPEDECAPETSAAVHP